MIAWKLFLEAVSPTASSTLLMKKLPSTTPIIFHPTTPHQNKEQKDGQKCRLHAESSHKKRELLTWK